VNKFWTKFFSNGNIMRSSLPFEAVAVGIFTVVVFYLIKFMFSNFSLMFALFLTGILIHVTFEALGWNEQWCRATFF
jgi:hypothetical protein